jgi:manganese-dependent inorganic pyrophosphatase
MTTPIDTFTTARLVNQSIPVGAVMSDENLITFSVDDFIDDIKDKMLNTRYRSYPVVDEKNRIKGFISRYHLISQRKKKVILLDHNEKSQTVNGIEEAEILEIIDHHRLGDLQTASPIFIRNEPLGSTSTIVANMYFESGIRPTKSIAGILCSASLSAPLQFKSPPTTYTDRITAEKLAEIAGIRILTNTPI